MFWIRRERQRETQRETERQRDRHRDRHRDRYRDRQRQTDRETETRRSHQQLNSERERSSGAGRERPVILVRDKKIIIIIINSALIPRKHALEPRGVGLSFAQHGDENDIIALSNASWARRTEGGTRGTEAPSRRWLAGGSHGSALGIRIRVRRVVDII